jgi:hypothetical protein
VPIGIVSDDEFDSELANSEAKINGRSVSIGSVLKVPSKGRAEGDNNVPDSLRKIIGETDILEGRSAGRDLAESFGLNPQASRAYASGITSLATPNTPKKNLADHLAVIKRNASKRAGKKLLAALDKITDEKLDEAPAGVLAGIAKSLSGVVRDLEPEMRNNVPLGTQFIVFAPQVAKESSFDVIDLKE